MPRCISPVAPLHLPCISTASPLHLDRYRAREVLVEGQLAAEKQAREEDP